MRYCFGECCAHLPSMISVTSLGECFPMSHTTEDINIFLHSSNTLNVLHKQHCWSPIAWVMGNCHTRGNILMVFIMPTTFKVGKDEKGKRLLEIAACVMLKGVVWCYLVERKIPKDNTDLLGGEILIALEEIFTLIKKKQNMNIRSEQGWNFVTNNTVNEQKFVLGHQHAVLTS